MAESTIAADKLCQLTGLTDLQLQNLARLGYFPKPKKSNYELASTLRGLFRYYREQSKFDEIAYSKRQAAEILGWPEERLTDFQKVGCPAFKHSRIYIGELIKWVGSVDLGGNKAGALRAEQIRESRARADLLEREKAELDKVLVRLDDVNKLINDSFLPIRQRFIALASEMANRCNPIDSKLAYDALQRWTDDALASIREQLPQPKAK